MSARSAGTLFLVMGAPAAGTRTVMARVREALCDMPTYAFPTLVGTREGPEKDKETVAPEEFQRRKVSGELQLYWRESDDSESGYRSCLSAIESGKNVAITVPQHAVAQVEKHFFFHTVHIVYVTASEEARTARCAQKGGELAGTTEKPQGPNVTTVVNSGTIAEGAADVIAALKRHAREVMEYPPATITLPVVRSAHKDARDYLSEEVLPGLQNAVKALATLSEKPRNPYLWLSDWLERNDPLLAKTGPGQNEGAGETVITALDVIKRHPVDHMLDSPEDIQGVANFRRSKKHERVYGVHQPTAAGVRAVVEQVCAEHGTCVWISTRDNPVVYVNGEPHTIHSKGDLEEDSVGVKRACVNNGKELARLERQMVRELTARSAEAGGRLQLVSPNCDKDDKDVEPDPTEVLPDGVSTFQGIFDTLEAEGFGVQLNRCLLCQDGAPEPEEIDEIVAAVRKAGDKAAIVFSCGSGVERTQVGMFLASLMFAVDGGATPKGYVDPPEGPAAPDLREKAQYKGITELCQSLEEGPVCKAIVDDVIDDNAEIINFRTIIFRAAYTEAGMNEAERSEAVCKAMDHLERYWYLIAIGSYFRKQVVDKFQQSFSTWMRAKRGVRRSLHKLCLV